jgi:hypothetical protein
MRLGFVLGARIVNTYVCKQPRQAILFHIPSLLPVYRHTGMHSLLIIMYCPVHIKREKK